MRALFAAAILGLAISGGCSNTDVTKTSKETYKATNAKDIEILNTKPDRAYIELGSIMVTDQKTSNEDKVHEILKDKAAKMGANAVYIVSTGLDDRKDFWCRGIAIRWK